MKNKTIFLITVLLLILLIILKVCLNSFVFSWQRVSEDEVFSLKNDLYLNKYELTFTKNLSTTPDSLYQKIIQGLDIWAEYKWHREPFLLFFHPVQKTEQKVIVLKSKKRFRFEEIDTTLIYIKIRKNGYSGSVRNGVHASYCVLEPKKELPDELDVIFYKNNLIEYFEAKLTKVPEE